MRYIVYQRAAAMQRRIIMCVTALLTTLVATGSLFARDRQQEVSISFAVPAVATQNEKGACPLAPLFEELQNSPEVVQSFFPESASLGAEIVTIASSSHDKVERGVSVDTSNFWQVTSGAPASCLSKCIRLPLGATLTELRLTYSNGRVPCLIKPIDGRRTPTLIGIVCQDSAWQEVLVQPGSRMVVCATAANFRSMRSPTANLMVLQYRDAAATP